MKRISAILLYICVAVGLSAQQAVQNTYLKPLLLEMQKTWPNRTI